MSSNMFSGRIEGQPFVAVQTFIESEQSQAAVAVDSMTPFNGTRMPEFDDAGWLFRPIDRQIPPQRVIENLEHIGAHVHEVGDVALAEVAKYVGPAVLEKVLRDPTA